MPHLLRERAAKRELETLFDAMARLKAPEEPSGIGLHEIFHVPRGTPVSDIIEKLKNPREIRILKTINAQKHEGFGRIMDWIDAQQTLSEYILTQPRTYLENLSRKPRTL